MGTTIWWENWLKLPIQESYLNSLKGELTGF